MNQRQAVAGALSHAVVRQALLVLGGVLLVAIAAQAAIPLPGTPIPLTLQGPAVLLAGVLLGPRLGATSLVLYLLLGAAGLPVFAPVAPPGLARLFGPSGGYLLAFPAAAAMAGQVVDDGKSWIRIYAGLLAGLLVIYAGGLAQLMVLTGSAQAAAQLGSTPFIAADLAKLAITGLMVRRVVAPARALR
jgi:biotin transport system substrate-specific component